MLLDKIRELRLKGQKGLAVLIDPDKAEKESVLRRVKLSEEAGVDFIFLGGSLVHGTALDDVIALIKENSSIPVILFPGSPLQLTEKADAVLFLSLISGRNPEYLIGNHVIAAPYLKKMDLEILPTGYMLVDGGVPTTASYMSGSIPLPNNKPQVAQATAMAGEMLGLGLLYLDAGSGAAIPVSKEMISAVKQVTDVPLIVGGGITQESELADAFNSGADIVVVGTSIEHNSQLIRHFANEKIKR